LASFRTGVGVEQVEHGHSRHGRFTAQPASSVNCVGRARK